MNHTFGTLEITGGVIVALAPTTPECAFDCDNNLFTITGGIVVGLGTSNYSKPVAGNQNILVLGSSAAGVNGTSFGLMSEVSCAFAFSISCSYDVMIISSPAIIDGTYTLKTGLTATGTVFHGLYLGEINATGGTTGSSVTVTTSNITLVGATAGITRKPGNQ